MKQPFPVKRWVPFVSDFLCEDVKNSGPEVKEISTVSRI